MEKSGLSEQWGKMIFIRQHCLQILHWIRVINQSLEDSSSDEGIRPRVIDVIEEEGSIIIQQLHHHYDRFHIPMEVSFKIPGGT